MYRVGDADVERLEKWTDDWNDQLDPLREFILPGGGPVSAYVHLGRTVCRRAERRVRTLSEAEPDVGEGVLRYLNRLSDLLFVMARAANERVGVSETEW
jgi:cob(I)alamin adenosyltransferase